MPIYVYRAHLHVKSPVVVAVWYRYMATQAEVWVQPAWVTSSSLQPSFVWNTWRVASRRVGGAHQCTGAGSAYSLQTELLLIRNRLRIAHIFELQLCSNFLKRQFTPKWSWCHYSPTLVSFQRCVGLHWPLYGRKYVYIYINMKDMEGFKWQIYFNYPFKLSIRQEEIRSN